MSFGRTTGNLLLCPKKYMGTPELKSRVVDLQSGVQDPIWQRTHGSEAPRGVTSRGGPCAGRGRPARAGGSLTFSTSTSSIFPARRSPPEERRGETSAVAAASLPGSSRRHSLLGRHSAGKTRGRASLRPPWGPPARSALAPGPRGPPAAHHPRPSAPSQQDAARGALGARPPRPRARPRPRKPRGFQKARAAPTAWTTAGRPAHSAGCGGAGQGRREETRRGRTAGGARRHVVRPPPRRLTRPESVRGGLAEVSPNSPPPGGARGKEEAQPVTNTRVGSGSWGGGGSWQHPLPTHPPPPPASGPRFPPTWPSAGRAPPDSVTGHSGHQTAASWAGLFPARVFVVVEAPKSSLILNTWTPQFFSPKK